MQHYNADIPFSALVLSAAGIPPSEISLNIDDSESITDSISYPSYTLLINPNKPFTLC